MWVWTHIVGGAGIWQAGRSRGRCVTRGTSGAPFFHCDPWQMQEVLDDIDSADVFIVDM